MNKSFLQTKEWLDFQGSLGGRVFSFDQGGIKANIIKRKLPFGKSYLYIPHGPEISLDNINKGLQNELANFIKYLRQLAYDNNSIFIKIEPLHDTVIELLYRRGFRYSKKHVQPHRTVIMDLNKSGDDLLSDMHQKTRYNIKVAEKHGITVEFGGNLDEFWKLLEKTTKRDRFSAHEKGYYEKLLNFFKEGEVKTYLVMARKEGEAVAGALIMEYGDMTYYLHGASDYKYRSMMAPYALHWEIIKKLKSSGSKSYDFWGIDSKKWPGVTRFKLGWGGKETEYPGAFDMTVSWFWTLLYNIARKIF